MPKKFCGGIFRENKSLGRKFYNTYNEEQLTAMHAGSIPAVLQEVYSYVLRLLDGEHDRKLRLKRNLMLEENAGDYIHNRIKEEEEYS